MADEIDAAATTEGGEATTNDGITPQRPDKAHEETHLAADTDIEAQQQPRTKKGQAKWTLWLAFGTLGVVYGDVGTSPLYVFASIFTDPPSEADLVGATSLVIWSITALVLIKYAVIVLRADDHGQGGTFALYAQLRRQGTKAARGNPKDGTQRVKAADWRQRLIESRKSQNVLRVLVVLGVGAILGDGVLTPAVSVVSACEGLTVATSSVTRKDIVGIASGILVALFLIQRFGTAKIGLLFSPIASVWFSANFAIGMYNIFKYNPAMFRAVSPHYLFTYLARNGRAGWESLAGALLAFTGTEALFADLGHFNRHAIQLAFVCIVYPSLVVTYIGQASYLSAFPENVSQTYYKALPGWTFWPMFAVATATAIVASQAMISASFQIVKQAIAQSFFPRFNIKHTNKKHEGQIYISVINWTLMTLTIIVVATFQTSAKLGRAYGIAVIFDMALTTHFMTLLMVTVWRKHLIFPAMFYTIFAAIELTYVSSAVRKVPEGGWFSLMMAGIYAYIMLLWYYGSSRKNKFFEATRRQLGDLLRVRHPKAGAIVTKPQPALASARGKLQLAPSGVHVKRTPGVAVFYDESIYGVPHALVQLVTRLPVLPELCVFLTNRFLPYPVIMQKERFLVEQQGLPGFFHVVARYGYNERVVQDANFVQELLKAVMALTCRSLRLTMVESEVLKAEQAEALSDEARALVEEQAGSLYGKTHNSVLNADSSDPLSVSMTGIDTELRRRQKRRPTILNAEGAISWPTLGGEAAQDDTAGAVKPKPLTFPQEMGRFADKVARVVAVSDHASPLIARAGDLAGELALAAAAAQQLQSVTFVVGRSHLTTKPTWNLAKMYGLDLPFQFFVTNTGEPAHKAFGVPTDKVLEVGLIYTI
jgi:KUP system potassium uptake protein